MTQVSPKPIPVLDLSPEIDVLWDELNTAIQGVLKSAQFINGPEVKAFEDEVAQYLGTKHAIGVNSGTDALVIGLRALDIGPGDEVITTPFSFFATAESISNVGATPVFVDIEETSLNIDPSKLEAAITPQTKAIMPVHLFGRPAKMAQIMDIAAKYKLKVIEDCAQSFGARYAGKCEGCNGQTCKDQTRAQLSGKQTGTMGHVGAYSFFPSKNLGAFGDGGLIVTNDDLLAEQARKLHAHGSLKKYHNEMLGYNSRLDSLQAAILRVKLPHIDRWNEGRRRVAQSYNALLEGAPNIITPELTEGHVFHQYTVRLLDTDRDWVQAKLREAGISSMVYYPIPQDRLPVYAGQYPENKVSDEVAGQVLSLPIWPTLDEETQAYICQTLRSLM